MKRAKPSRDEAAGRLCQLLDAHLPVTRHESPAGRVRAPRPTRQWDESGPLPDMLAQIFGPESEEVEDPMEVFWELATASRPLLTFDWLGFGPTSSWAHLDLVQVGRGRWFVLWSAEDEGPRVVAALEPLSRATVSAVVADLLATNGRPYGICMFDGLPSSVVNGVPQLLPADVVRRGFRALMDRKARKDKTCWVELRDDTIGEAIQPDPLERSTELLHQRLGTLAAADRAERLAGATKRNAREAAELTAEDRKLIMDTYFERSYRTRG